MIKTSGYRVSPTEVEEVLYAHAAWSAKRRRSASRIRSSARRSWSSRRRRPGARARRRGAARRMPAAPAGLHGAGATIDVRSGPLPRNPNGKIDRKLLARECRALFGDVMTRCSDAHGRSTRR